MENTLSPKNFFLQLGIIATLYISTISFLTFVFNIIDSAFPDSNIYFNSYNGAIRYSISILIVVFPLFIWLSRIHRKNVALEAGKEGKLRKWLLFLTIFLTSIAMAVDLIVLINTFLGGQDLTTSFILKVLAVFAVSATIFYFYLKDIKGYWNDNVKGAKYISYILSAVVLLSVVGGFFVIGSPSNQRKLIQDSQKISDLSSIQSQIVYYYQLKGKVPASLDELKDPISGYIVPSDPETKVAYEYSSKTNLSFELCANFALAYDSKGDKATAPMYYNSLNENWNHDAGRTCFSRTIDPEKYPRINSGTSPKAVPVPPIY